MLGANAWTRRAVILTALDLEYSAVREHLTDLVEVVHEQGTVYERGTFTSDTHMWDVLIAQAGMGNEGAAVEAERAIAHFSPEVALFVGVAGSLKPNDAGLGAVIAATKVYRYHSGKAGDTFLPRSEVKKSSYALLQRAQAVVRSGEWVSRTKGDLPEVTPKALTGPIAAGEQVVASEEAETYRFIREHYSDAVAIEMEGSGFLSAAYANAQVDALVIRGISDLVRGKGESDSQGWQPVAARHAAAFAFEILARYVRSGPAVTPPRIRNVPHPRNPNFTGREGLLDKLHIALTSGEVTALTQPQAIYGLGGIGKTQIAVEYAYRHESDYDIVWWVRAEGAAVLASDYAALANQLGLTIDESSDQSQIVEMVRRWLEQNGKWLLILDNAPDLASVRGYLPRGGTSHVLITSRNATRWGDGAHPISVGRWEIEEATNFLAIRTGQEDEQAASDLAEEVGRLPLALAQAGAYIDEVGITIARYTELFRMRRAQIMAEGQPLDYPDTVATTWDISFNHIKGASSGAADLINLCAFFAPDDIPRDLIAGGAPNLPEPLAATVADPLMFNCAIALTRRYSLLEVREGSILSMHRLVQAVVRDKLGDEAGQWATSAALLIDRALPYDADESSNWQVLGRMLPQALAAETLANEYNLTPELVAPILVRAGSYLRVLAKYHDALAPAQEALAIAESHYGHDDIQTVPYLNLVGLTLHDLGELKEARAYFERVMQIYDSNPTIEDDHTYAIVGNNFARLLEAQGDFVRAYVTFHNAIITHELVFGPNSSKVAAVVHNFGHLLYRMGNLPEARVQYERALRIDMAKYSDDHGPIIARDVMVAKDLNSLGSVLADQGELISAQEYIQGSWEICEAAYGSNHPNTAAALSNLGRVLTMQNLLPEAKEHCENALSIVEALDDVDQGLVAFCNRNLGDVWIALGDDEKARGYIEKARTIDRAIYAPNDLTHIADDLRLARIMMSFKEWHQARTLFSQALGSTISRYGREDIKVAERLMDLSLALVAAGDLGGARTRVKAALKIMRKSPDAADPMLLDAEEALAMLER